MFDDLIPAAAKGAGMFDDLVPKKVEPGGSAGLLQGHYDAELAARQGVNPHAMSPSFPEKPENKPVRLGDLEEHDFGQAYTDAKGELKAINKKTDFLARDPETGKMAVYARNAQTDENRLVSASRLIMPGLAVGPVAGIQRAAPRAAEAAGALVPAVPQRVAPTGAALATERAGEAVQDAAAFDNLGVRKFGPAFNQGPVASVAKQLTETPLVGAPLKNALDDALRDTAQAAEGVASRYGSATTPETAGAAIRGGIERYKDARPADIIEQAEAARRSPPPGVPQVAPRTGGAPPIPPMGPSAGVQAQRSEIIRAPARETSLKTKQAALYEQAWSRIPEEMQQGRSVEGEARVLGGMPETRALLSEIHTRNLRTINKSAPGAAAAAMPVATSGFVGRMVSAVMTPNWRAALQSMRDIRSNFRRMSSQIADSEANTMRLSDIDRVESAITRDMIALLSRNVEHYRATQQHDVARNMERAIVEFRRADKFTRAAMTRMEALEKLFNAPSSEALYRNVTNSALSKGRGDLDKLRALRKTLRGEEMNDVAAAVIRQLGEPTGAARGVTQELGFSVQSFMTKWQNMTPEARALLFGGEHAGALDDLVRVASRMANVEALANTSRSGTNALNLTGLLGAGGMLASGQFMSALGVAGTGLGASLLLSRPAYARWAVDYARLRAAALRAPVTSTTPHLVAHINRLGQLAKADQALLPIYRAVAAENGIGDADKPEQPDKP
jgi:hypothetical protein